MLVIDSRDGVRLVADVINAGAVPTVLFLPCGAELRAVWQPVIAGLADDIKRDWRIVAADHRGHGDSGRSPSYRFAQFLEDLHCWIDELQGKPLLIVGGSIGGAMGMVAAGEGSNIDGLVLLDVPRYPRSSACSRSVRASAALATGRILPCVPSIPISLHRVSSKMSSPTSTAGGTLQFGWRFRCC